MADLDVKALLRPIRGCATDEQYQDVYARVEAALISAHEAGRAAGAEQMREAAAAVLDDMACGSAATLDMALFRSGAQAIRTLSFRALPLPAPPKESGS